AARAFFRSLGVSDENDVVPLRAFDRTSPIGISPMVGRTFSRRMCSWRMQNASVLRDLIQAMYSSASCFVSSGSILYLTSMYFSPDAGRALVGTISYFHCSLRI